LAPLHDTYSATRLAAERSLNARLGGACTVPVAGHAIITGTQLHLTALVASPDGLDQVRDEISGASVDAAALGQALAERLLDNGARAILAKLGIDA
jgi:hydroxymethylbilane synthase